MANASQTWGCCSNENIAEEKFIACPVCKLSFHYACLSITDAGTNWKCPTCLRSARKTPNKDSTPVRNMLPTRGNKRPAIGSPSPPSKTCDKEDLRALIQESIKTELDTWMDKINKSLVTSINKELEPMRNEMKGITESLTFLSDKFDEIEKGNVITKNKLKDLEEENIKLRTTICDLNARMNYIEQQSRSNNLELQCMPESNHENLVGIAIQLGKTVNCEISEKDILNCTRIAKSSPNNKRPRSVVMQFVSPRLRDQLLASTIKYNKANPQEKLHSSHLGSNIKTPVYVVEHLSPSNKALHAAARIKAKEMEYKFVWIRNGRIFVRKNENSDYLLVRNMDSLNKII